VQAYQTSQYVVPRGGIFLGKWCSSFAVSSDGKMHVHHPALWTPNTCDNSNQLKSNEITQVTPPHYEKTVQVKESEVLTCVVMKSSVFWDIMQLLPASWWFLPWLILRLWRWRRHVPPKRQLTFNGLRRYIPEDRTVRFKLCHVWHRCARFNQWQLISYTLRNKLEMCMSVKVKIKLFLGLMN
jgi:hypothetical protein